MNILLFILSLFPIVNLLTPGLPVTHDGQDHVARIANFYLSLREGNIVPRWAGNLNWGFGHPILMFLYPLPSYIGSFFHALGFSLADSTKLVFATAFIASIFAMYVWLREHWGKIPAFVGAILYGFTPYRFVDLYVRGAIGEHVAFIFPPFILLGLYKRSAILTSLAMAGLILSHNAVSLMFLPIIALYTLYLKRDIRFILLGFLLSAFFWFPAFFEGKYTLRDIVTKGEFSDRFVPWSWFFFSPWNYGGGAEFTKQLGIAQWVSLVIALIFRNKLLILIFLTLFLMTQESTIIWNNVSILQKFQFPWRFLSVTTFLTAVIGAVSISQLPKRYLRVSAIIICTLAIISTSHMWKAKEYSIKPESFYSGIYEGTTDTGESSPIWSVRFMEKRPKDEIELIEGDAGITKIQRTSTKHEYSIEAHSRSRIVENTLYFPGWQVLIDGKPTIIEFQDPSYRGLMTFWVEPGNHTIDIIFGDTKLRIFANVLSLVGIGVLIIYAKIRIRSSSV